MKIYDNILDNHFLNYLNYILSRLQWRPEASFPNQKSPLFFNSMVITEDVQKDEFLFLFDIIISIIKNEPEIKGKNIILEKAYVNLYPSGIGGDWHVDSAASTSKTILFYPSDWKKEYGGATEFLNSGEKVEYIKNRLLVFDGSKSHRSAVHQNPKNRYTIAFKTHLKKIE